VSQNPFFRAPVPLFALDALDQFGAGVRVGSRVVVNVNPVLLAPVFPREVLTHVLLTDDSDVGTTGLEDVEKVFLRLVNDDFIYILDR